MAVRGQQLYTEGVNRSEERAAKCFHSFEGQSRFQNSLPGALLHFVRGAIRVSDDDQLRQPFGGALSIFRDLNDAVGDRARLTGAGRSDDRKILIELGSKTSPRLLVSNFGHFVSSSVGMENAGWVNTHFFLSSSGSLDSVASGYFLTNPKSLWTG